MLGSPSRKERARQRGGTVAVGIFGAIVGGLTLLWSVQIMTQAWSRTGTTSLGCREGVQALVGAVRRARQAAAAETGGERAAIERFRAELQPEWSSRAGLDTGCSSDRDALRLLRELDLLRYAEERSVRSDAVDVARRRRRVRTLEAQLALPSAAAANSSDLAKRPRAN